MKAMSSAGSSSSGGNSTQTKYYFERTYVVHPKGTHLATVVWLHGLGDNGSSWFKLLEDNPWENIKWICPTAPLRPITLFEGSHFTTWFDVKDLFDNTFVDEEGLDASAAHVASLLADEPSDIKLVVGGFSIGAATSLYFALCFAHGRFGDGKKCNAKLSAVIGFNGWLPCSQILDRKIEAIEELVTLKKKERYQRRKAIDRAASLHIYLRHDKGDNIIPDKFSMESFQKLTSFGFQNVLFLNFIESASSPHVPDMSHMEDVVSWLTENLGLRSSAS